MSKEPTKSTWLEGKQVACTGSLACMTRAGAADLIHAFGGRFVPSVTRKTNVLLVGQEGWPLQKDGTLTGKLQRAQRLQRAGFPIHILAEEEFLEQLGLSEQSSGVRRLFTTAQVCRLLSVSGERLRRWIESSLLQPAESSHGVHYFDFPQVSGLKTLCELACAGVSTKQLRQSLEHLRGWMPNLDRPLEQLALLERDGQLMVRLDEGLLAEATGQLQFDFECKEPLEQAPQIHTAEEWFELGCAEEEAERWTEAAAAYRQALLLGGPDAAICFNLGNVLYALDQKGQAAERFRQAVELKADFPEAW